MSNSPGRALPPGTSYSACDPYKALAVYDALPREVRRVIAGAPVSLDPWEARDALIHATPAWVVQRYHELIALHFGRIVRD